MGTKEFDADKVKKWLTMSGWYINPKCPAPPETKVGEHALCECVNINDPRLSVGIIKLQKRTAGRKVAPFNAIAPTPPMGTSANVGKRPGRGDTFLTDAKPAATLADNNPKTRIGALKAPLQLIPPSAEVYMAEALADGAKKYGAYNWREEPISVSTYIGAMRRHLGAFWDGEDCAADSGVNHLAHVMACCALLLDSQSLGILNDDRPPAGNVDMLLESYVEKNS